MKNIYKKLGFFLILLASACKLDGDLQNPNEVSVAGSDPDLLLNGIQLNFADFFHSASGTADPLVRMQAMTGGYRYQTAYNPTSLDNLWSLAYRGVLINNAALQPIAANKNLTTHVAIGKILEAYTWLTLVDLFGDVPQANALKGATGNFNPATTSGSDIYAYAIQTLEDAKTQLALTGSAAGAAVGRDIFYGGSRTLWNALANTLELKAWINISMIPARAAEANAKIATFIDPASGTVQSGVDIIDLPAESFKYGYGTVTVPGGSRHPWYDQYYGSTAGTAAGYWCNYYLYNTFGKWDPTDPNNQTKTIQDPRWRYYFYRQVGSLDHVQANFDPKAIGCTPGAVPPNYSAWGGNVFCVFEPGFFGRDHGDASGTPPDGATITCAGVYPAGGRPDNTSIGNKTYNGSAKRLDGANGGGIEPIWMNFFTDYLVAEVLARNGSAANARTRLLTAITNSISAVKNFADGKSQSVTIKPWNTNSWSPGPVPGDNCASLAPPITVPATPPSAAYLQCLFNKLCQDYMTSVGSSYDAAGIKTDVIGQEFWISLIGNGVEAYNMYRRTSAPRNMQPTLQVSSDPYFRSLVYPANYANLNSSATQKDVTVTNKVFWDNNPDNLN
jgi:hypothetical protein